MLVIAHPGTWQFLSLFLIILDDESMFFIPFVSSCVKQGKKVSILCLSKGIEPGLVRYNELLSAAKVSKDW
jgi:hypothetical protein